MVRRLGLALAVLGAPGCARRVYLAPAELAELQRLDPEYAQLRVFPSRALLSYYRQLGDPRRVEVTHAWIKERGVSRPHERVVGREAAGKIVAVESLSSMPLLWVTFFADCAEKSCAFGFVQTELGRYSLVSVPALAGFQEPTSYRRNRLRRNALRLSRQRSLAELNEVLAAVRGSGRRLTIDLQVRKSTFRRTLKTRVRAGGARE